MISIIIPTLNEEDYLPILLQSIKKQGIADLEIIVADAGSTDKTLQTAKQYGCIVVPGGLPAKGRNSGARVAHGDLLFFLDSDTVLSDDFLKKTLEEFNRRKLDMASFCLSSRDDKKLSSFLVEVFYNRMIIALEQILPHSAVGILVKKELFESLNGYNEKITLAEDHDLGRRAAKKGRFGIIRSVKIVASDRRYKTDGWVSIGVKYFLCELHMIFIGPVTSDIFKYKFNHYKKAKKGKP